MVAVKTCPALLHMRDEIENLSNELVGLDFWTCRENYGSWRDGTKDWEASLDPINLA